MQTIPNVIRRCLPTVAVISGSLCFSLIFFTPTNCRAAALSWSGASPTSANWSDSANWGSAGVPANGDTLIFSAAQPRPTNTNDLGNLTLSQIRFLGAGGGYVINGSALTVTNSIEATNTSGANTINPGIGISGSNFSINVGAGATLTLAGALTGSAGVTKNGTGTLTYTGTNDNTYSGTTTVSSGLLQLNKTNGFGLAIPHALILSNSTTVRCLSAHQIWSFGAATTLNTSSLLDLAGNDDAVGLLTLNGGQITTGAGVLELQENIIVRSNTTTQSIISGKLLLVTSTISISNVSHWFSPDLRITASIGSSGNQGITKNGDGEVSLAASNYFFGPITVNRGNLWADNASSFGNVTNTATVNSNGGIFLNAASVGAKPLILNGTGWGGGGALSASGASAWGGSINLASDSTINIFSAADSLNLTGAISGPGGATKIGAGTLSYGGSSPNLYSGVTTVKQGILQLNKSSGFAIGDGSLVIGDGAGGADSDIVRYTGASPSEVNITVPITITPSGLLDLNNHNDDVGPITFAGGDISTGTGFLQAGGDFNVLATNRTANVSGNVQFLGGSPRRINVADGSVFYDILFTANISDSGGGLIISNSNPLGNFVIFRGSNSFNGPLTIDQTILSAETPWALGTTNGSTTVKSNSTLWLYVTGITNESVTLNAGAQLVGQYECTWTGPIALTGDALIQGFGGVNGFNLLGQISGTGNLSLFTDGGTLRMLGAALNDYSGTTTFGPGFLDLNRTNFDSCIPHDFIITNGQARLLQLNQIKNGANVSIGPSGSLVLSNSVLDRVGTLSGSGSVNLGTAGNYLVVGDPSNNGSSTYNGVISGAGDLWKDAAGTLTLTGSNTYSGTTFVLGGVLVVNGYQPASLIDIASGSPTLGGNGTVGEIFCRGNLRPGTSPGILTCSNLTFTSTGNLYLDLNGHTPGTTHDQLNVRGTNTLANAALHISSSLTNPVAVGDQLVFIKNDLSDPITGTFLSWGAGSSLVTSGGARLVISYTGGTGNDAVFTVTEVPTDAVGSSVTSGNGSHIIDPDECNNLVIVITNKTGSPMTGISAVLSTTNVDALVTQPYSSYPNVPANGKATNSTSFQISTLPAFVCGSSLNLRLTVSSASHGSFTIPVVLSSGVPSGVPNNRYDNNSVTNIPDIGAIESTNVVVGFTGPLTKVAVSLWLTHPVDSDLIIALIAPDNTSVDLSSGNGAGANYGAACSPDSSRATFDDAAASSITAGSSPFVGSFRPEVSLTNVLASPPNGVWRLHVTDAFGGSVGALRCWSLLLYGMSCGTGNGACGFCLASITDSVTTNSLVQTGRFTRNGIGSGCGQPKSCPALNDAAPHHYNIHSFTNNSGAEACITIDLASNCGNNAFAAAYLNSFNPSDLCANYLGDPGISGSNVPFSITVPAGAVYQVVVCEVNQNLGCANYTLSISGLPCPPPSLNIQTVSAGNARLYWTNSAGGYLLESTPTLLSPAWSPTTDEPLINGGNYNVTNDFFGSGKFYRLHKP